MATLDEISKERQRVSEALARVDAQREKLVGQLGELEATERVLARYSKGPRPRNMASARTPIAATKVAAPARSGGRPRTTVAKPAGSKRSSPSLSDQVLAWQAVRCSRKSPLHARALAQIMSAPPFPGTSAPAASKSATGNSTPRSRRLKAHSQGARNDGRRNRSSTLGKAFRSGGTESSNPASSSGESCANLIWGEGRESPAARRSGRRFGA